MLLIRLISVRLSRRPNEISYLRDESISVVVFQSNLKTNVIAFYISRLSSEATISLLLLRFHAFVCIIEGKEAVFL